jgi:hypothetical protein
MSLSIREVQIKTILRFYLPRSEWQSSRKHNNNNKTPTSGKYAGKKGPLYTLGGNIN